MSGRWRTRGNWKGRVRSFRQQAELMSGGPEVSVADIGQAVQDELRRRMLAGPPPGLTPETIDRKRRRGARRPAATWLDTEWLVDHGTRLPDATASKGFNQLTIELVTSNERHPSGPTAEEVFRFMEFGTRRQRPRPVFGPLREALVAGKVPRVERLVSELTEALVSKLTG